MKSAQAHFAQRLAIAAAIVCGFALVYYALPHLSAGPSHHFRNEARRSGASGGGGGGGGLTLLDAFYFSLVTQSTVGYGSIVPVSTVAKAVVAAQVTSTLAFLIYLSTGAKY